MAGEAGADRASPGLLVGEAGGDPASPGLMLGEAGEGRDVPVWCPGGEQSHAERRYSGRCKACETLTSQINETKAPTVVKFKNLVENEMCLKLK